MAKSLVIVESPAKAKTINKYLGANFLVKASVGHIKDLPEKKLGVDVEHDFEPEYVVIDGKAKVIDDLKSAAKQADSIYLAPDPDREGEAISWHIAEELKSAKGMTKNIYRVMFNEITKKGITDAMQHPGQIDTNRVDAQQARRILDRLVGYKISPLLWKKVQKGLSAGRVQSVALRIICEREKEIAAFVTEEYWSITARLAAKKPPIFDAKLLKIGKKKAEIANQEQALAIVADVKNAQFIVESVTKKETKRNPVAPFTTSTLQQEAARKLRFSSKKTMSVAQKLYEGIDLGKEGPVGLITYMRTDSTRISDEAVNEARQYINEKFGGDYLPSKPQVYKTQKSAQEAHEAIRPTSVYREPDAIKSFLTNEEFRLYELIWKRLLASQMQAAIMDVTTIDVLAGTYLFRATGSVMKFAGFMKLYIEGADPQNDQEQEQDQAKEQDVLLPPVEKGDVLDLKELLPKQSFTQPPSRYTEASLVKELEKQGIGRPSTYASIISTIVDRQYVALENRKIKPSELGMLITDLLVENFPKILDVGFTANLEEQLDKIEEGELNWVKSLSAFYQSFEQELERAAKEMRNVKQEREEITDEICEKCGKPMKIKYGRFGKFLACTGFPKCKNTKQLDEVPAAASESANEGGQPQAETPQIEETCPNCGKPMVLKRGRFGSFLACSGYPDCKTTQKIAKGKNGETVVKAAPRVTEEKCEKCGANLLERQGRNGAFLACSNYPKCKFTKPVGGSSGTGVKCTEEGCDGEFTQRKGRFGRFFYSCSRYPDCKATLQDKPIPRPCPKCHAPFLVEKWNKATEQTFVACANKTCDYSEA
ncbi:DNA topoisomerase I [Candidatus Moduliflexus flocculans]|uniref:DNA topoisomerase 1 n=1 Tax=Candidatus Moduliflexus flocculans TaxID=1499966 RepID=A0A0S6W4C5_9BACT|nr:DNA topoisomerase I [Candidatus Moduliflexus flocculans]